MSLKDWFICNHSPFSVDDDALDGDINGNDDGLSDGFTDDEVDGEDEIIGILAY